MARNHSTQTIPPFPANIDREAFANWLTEFTDGEGCFYLGYSWEKKTNSHRPRAQFIITLRADDLPILLQIQSFFGCGRAYLTNKIARGKPIVVAVFYVTTTCDLADKVIPQFERYPLRAKKAADFLIWKEAVLIAAEVGRRRVIRRIGVRGGGRPKWTPEERQRYFSLVQRLRSQREFKHPHS